MPDTAHLAAFAVAAITIAAIPGPGMLYVPARSLGGGRSAGMRSSVGTGIGGLVHVGAAAIGLSALIAASAVAFSIVKYLGAAYLIWLGLRTLLARDSTPPGAALGHGAGRVSEWLRARPKAWRRQQVATGSILVGLGVYAAAAGHRAK